MAANSSIPSLERKVIKIDPTATSRRRQRRKWEERLRKITLDSIKEHMALCGRISGQVLRTIRDLINNETCGKSFSMILRMYVSMCIYLLPVYNIEQNKCAEA